MRLQIGNFPRHLDFEARLTIGGGLGYGSTSISPAKLDEYIQNDDLNTLKALLAKNGLVLANVWPGPLYHHEGELWDRVLDQAIPRIKAIAELGGTQIGINTPNRWPKAVTEFEWDWLIDKYRRYADVLRDYGLNLVLEYLGPHVGRPRSASVVMCPWIDNIVSAVELVERINRPNVGLILDVIHWWAGGGTYEDLHRVKGIPLALHFFDLPHGITRETVEDTDRVLPGEGFVDLVQFLRILKEDGFDGDAMPEILRSDELDNADSWKGPQKIRDAYFKVFEQV